MSRRIPLRGQGGLVKDHALVDDHDFGFLSLYNWHRVAGGYAGRTSSRPEQRLVYMHRQIVGLQPGERDEVDHINRDKLDNRRQNLRVVSHRENGQNQGGRRGKTSRFRGVSWDKRHKRWVVRVCAYGETHYLGLHKSEDEAGRVAAAFYAERLPPEIGALDDIDRAVGQNVVELREAKRG